MSAERRVAAFFALASQDLDAAEVLARVGNQYAAYHVQQAVEKLVKGLLLAMEVEAGIEHRLDILVRRFPEDDPWPGRIRSFLHYTAYATAYRYPSIAGRIAPKPAGSDVLRDVDALRMLLNEARKSS